MTAKKKKLDVADLSDEQVATIIDEDSEAFSSFVKTAEKAGLPKEIAAGLIRRVRAMAQETTSELRTVKAKEFLDILDDRAFKALGYLDDFALANASAKDLAVIAGILLEKRQLLRGEPTAILSIDDRRSLNDLVAGMTKEAARRNMLIDNDTGEVLIPYDDAGPRDRSLIRGGMHHAVRRHKAGLERAEIGNEGTLGQEIDLEDAES